MASAALARDFDMASIAWRDSRTVVDGGSGNIDTRDSSVRQSSTDTPTAASGRAIAAR